MNSAMRICSSRKADQARLSIQHTIVSRIGGRRYPDAELLSHLVSWLGIDRRPGVEGFTETLTGALSIEELEAAE